ncbi:MAG: histidine kinase [Chitinophagaceae bacterium]|nr:histidine kinase [Chitinophagaceae bacterium]MCB9045710.1 histidine kinase [Chitinophagales bacterium]
MLPFYRLLICLLLSLLTITGARASSTDTGVIPRSLVLDQRWNYNNYTNLVLPTINWLQNTPLDTEHELRARHDNFLMFWLQKNEDIVVHMPDYLVNFQNADRELYFIYTGGWIKHAMETGDRSRTGNALAAVESVLDFYNHNKGITRSDYLDKLTIIQKAGKLPSLFDSSEQAQNTYVFLTQPADHDHFKPSENYFNFRYTGINFTNTKSLHYRYKLSGYYDNWINTDETSVTFPNLPSGDYKFTVQASTYPDFAHAVEDNYSFTIATPFYKQPWFIILAIASCIILAYLYVRWRERQLKQIANLKHERVVFEYEYLKSQVNPHFLFNSLNTLTNLIEENPKTAVDYTAHLSDLYRNMLAHPDRNLVNLSEELDILNNYIHIQKSRFGDALIVKQDIPQAVAKEKKIIYLALQLLVENAIKHNIVSLAQPLVITITADEKEIVVTNPIHPKMSTGKPNGMGLDNISKRYKLATNMNISFGPEDGTFVVKLPLLS